MVVSLKRLSFFNCDCYRQKPALLQGLSQLTTQESHIFRVLGHYLAFLFRCYSNPVDDNLLQHLSPLGWEHINLTGDYVWRQSRKMEQGKFRPLRPLIKA